MFRHIFEFKKSARTWHLPLIAGICIGVPILGGYFSGYMAEGKLASLAALVILYIQSFDLVKRMMTLMVCSFTILLSFSVGIVFSFNPAIAPLVLGLLCFSVNRVLYYMDLDRPPGNFFFIMVASVAICMPFDLAKIPSQIGFVAIGTMISCGIGLLYSVITLRNLTIVEHKREKKETHANLIESIIYGGFVALSLLVANLLKLDNPYWVPTSCLAVMQGVTTHHVITRGMQRVLGTFLGLGLAWLVLLLQPSVLEICFMIIGLQIIAEFLVVRNYAITVVFVTVLTILLAERGDTLKLQPNHLFAARFFDILIGSAIGAVGGLVLYNKQIHDQGKLHIEKAKMRMNKKREI
ncbi:FUSC family protein [Pedobacter ureilyticus]|uniref:FUSC family protein n=1 Tax=Pedobacter ureilyticus TaxID=1393051 RepID=A0ABW9JC96_9SPHI|nr:FUSC family protein [Pedobacter helvus]